MLLMLVGRGKLTTLKTAPTLRSKSLLKDYGIVLARNAKPLIIDAIGENSRAQHTCHYSVGTEHLHL